MARRGRDAGEIIVQPYEPQDGRMLLCCLFGKIHHQRTHCKQHIGTAAKYKTVQ